MPCLSEMSVGRYTITDIGKIDTSDMACHDFVTRRSLFGFYVGSQISILKKRSSAMIVRTPLGRFAIGFSLARLIHVSDEEEKNDRLPEKRVPRMR